MAYDLSKDGETLLGLRSSKNSNMTSWNFLKLIIPLPGGDALKEMKPDSAEMVNTKVPDYFSRVPYNYCDKLNQIPVYTLPDFRIQLKIDPSDEKALFATDVNSVFNICWYTLAKKIYEDVEQYDKVH